ncbi:cellulose synthase/poly-beta-1,6-N-acetylglucosamine synthase-like glycosyltransferase [Pullulanibacillus pueri]|uniref:Uncharacterized protein n=1 Tax=Pullulanibacillus pueri TaxID=1437324 RepID=A0A8J2ZXF1_9BACL|nr:DUF6114 domain-containing protein [Pullulanibacillus pueri]MBM7684015.1 cellulose synthase/poly-beta-1,6-N-acetylglucosamine synthase-like glycosyltransferase [Pullulanibacillus pueri]GGH85081.1 hypothetical protein GCM10007096_29640 [Pullulanibacillus pueri]
MVETLSKWQKFKHWKNTRPFWGATLSLLSGLLILWIPLQLYAIAFAPGSMAFIGFLFGGLILILSVLLYIYPQFNILCGIIIIFLAVLSVMGALGGFLMGTLVGIIGGAMAIAWKKTTVEERTPTSENLPSESNLELEDKVKTS